MVKTYTLLVTGELIVEVINVWLMQSFYQEAILHP